MTPRAYLEEMLARFDGALPLAIAAYNAGPNRVDEWLGTYGDWRTARNAYDVGQAELGSLGARLGKEYILPVTVNKATRQAAIIADLEPDAAQKLCAQYRAKKLFCEVKKPQDFVAPFGAFWR